GGTMICALGPARLQVSSPLAKGVSPSCGCCGIDLTSAKAVARRVVNGEYSGTLPEMERLARKLRESGITAVATRP
ncbi:hypothetical protein, partial [Streptomyces chartreusis]